MMAKDDEKKTKRTRVSQSEFPRESLARALSISQAIWDNFAGKEAPPHEIALALDLSPTSGGWRNMCGTSIAYGLTEGGYNANSIILTELGRRIVAPTSEGDDAAARVEAILQPRIMGDFFRKYDKAKFPKEAIAENVLVGMGMPKERAARAVQLIQENGIYAGVLRDTKTGLFVALGSPAPQPEMEPEEDEDVTHDSEPGNQEGLDAVAKRVSGQQEAGEEPETTERESNRVFISHGKNKKIVAQIKELLTFGKFIPIVSVEKDTASVPVPEKVFNDMRQCGAAVIHVSKEGELLDSEGNTHTRINENVLIEIGAAIALYKNRFILLVEKGVTLPSNLQGLYRCEYEGDQLDYEATMKLLKTFNEFR